MKMWEQRIEIAKRFYIKRSCGALINNKEARREALVAPAGAKSSYSNESTSHQNTAISITLISFFIIGNPPLSGESYSIDPVFNFIIWLIDKHKLSEEERRNFNNL